MTTDTSSLNTGTEIIAGDVSGGSTTSQTITIASLGSLIDSVPATASAGTYEQAVVDENVLGKGSDSARRRVFRHLRELYILRPDSILFRALRDLWAIDPAARPLLAGLVAVARDAAFRASSLAILNSSPGEVVKAVDLAAAVDERFPGNYGEGTLGKIGRNTFSSWTQTGHLEAVGRTAKIRSRAACMPANLALALFLGHLEGKRGQALFETLWVRLLDRPISHLMEIGILASRQGLLEFRASGGIVEVGFQNLSRPVDDKNQGASP
jgi:hypothetical protein